jgi:uncharacterized HAD superfamily protein
MINIKTAKRKYSVDIDGVSTGEVTCVEITNQDDTKNIVPVDNNNTDYQTYLEWVADGNTPQ